MAKATSKRRAPKPGRPATRSRNIRIIDVEGEDELLKSQLRHLGLYEAEIRGGNLF